MKANREYTEGYRAFLNNFDILENPYSERKETERHNNWNEGYSDSRDQNDNIQVEELFNLILSI